MKHWFIRAAAMAFVVTALNGCVNHYCGPSYPGSNDPFCSIHRPSPAT
jgi:hypothetical protein